MPSHSVIGRWDASDGSVLPRISPPGRGFRRHFRWEISQAGIPHDDKYFPAGMW